MMVLSHMVFAGGIAALCGVSFKGSVALALGGAFPDKAENVIAGRNREIWRRIHRTITHWPPLYPGLLALLLFFNRTVPDPVTRYAFLFIMGALIHIAMDFLTPMGIPLVHPFQKKGRAKIPLIQTRSLADYAFGFLPLGCWLVLTFINFR